MTRVGLLDGLLLGLAVGCGELDMIAGLCGGRDVDRVANHDFVVGLLEHHIVIARPTRVPAYFSPGVVVACRPPGLALDHDASRWLRGPLGAIAHAEDR